MSISPSQGGILGGSDDPTWRPEPSSGRPKWFTVFILVAFVALFAGIGYLVMELKATRANLEQANQKIRSEERRVGKECRL